jgi:sporulation protein YlmC with PRC-barrel domain
MDITNFKKTNPEDNSRKHINNEKIFATNLMGKIVVGRAGKKFGQIADLIFDTQTGEIIDFTLNNSSQHMRDISLEKDSDGDYLIPFHSVNAIGDFVVISEDEIIN